MSPIYYERNDVVMEQNIKLYTSFLIFFSFSLAYLNNPLAQFIFEQ